MAKLTRGWPVLLIALSSTVSLSAGAQQLTSRDQRYVLRPGDTLETEYRLTPDLNQTFMIEPDGHVNLQVAGDLKLGGLTVEQARQLILKRDSVSLVNPELNLVLKGFTQPTITVAGEVSKPGRFDLRENTSALEAVMEAGGFTAGAKTGQVLVFRKVDDQLAEVHQLKLGKINNDNQLLEHDMDLRPGDVVYVPRDKISKLQHYMSLSNVGMYFDPTQFFP